MSEKDKPKQAIEEAIRKGIVARIVREINFIRESPLSPEELAPIFYIRRRTLEIRKRKTKGTRKLWANQNMLMLRLHQLYPSLSFAAIGQIVGVRCRSSVRLRIKRLLKSPIPDLYKTGMSVDCHSFCGWKAREKRKPGRKMLPRPLPSRKRKYTYHKGRKIWPAIQQEG